MATPTSPSMADPSSEIEVRIYDGETFLQNVPVNADGSWSWKTPALSLTRHSFTARTAAITSQARTLTIATPIPPLVMDASLVTLQTKLYILQTSTVVGVPKFPAGSTVTRTPSGGRPPYTYSSSNSAIVDVNAAGFATPKANGSATITVKDQANQSKSYVVTVANVLTAYYLGELNWQTAVKNQKPGGHLNSRAELREIMAQYDASNWPSGLHHGRHYWTSDYDRNNLVGPLYWSLRPTDGNQASQLGQSYYYPSLSIFSRVP